MEIALRSLISRVKKSPHVKEYALGIFLDTEGAFNNVHPDAIVRGLSSHNLRQDLVRFIELLFKLRIVISIVEVTHCQRIVCRGTPQGSVLSPPLLNLVVDLLWRRLVSSGNDVIAYADNIAIIVSGLCPQTFSIVLD